MEPITSGSIIFEGEEIAGLHRHAAVAVRRRIGMVFQSFELFQHLSAEDNIALAPIKVRKEGCCRPATRRGVRASAYVAGMVFGADMPLELQVRQRKMLDEALVAMGRDPSSMGIVWQQPCVIAETAGGKAFFRQVIETGGHPASLDRLIRGEGDVASIDCVTYAFWKHYRPEAAAQVRILAETPVSPAIPFVTSVRTSSPTRNLLCRSLRRLATEAGYETVRAGLKIVGIADVSDATYEGLLDYEREAAALGYPQLI